MKENERKKNKKRNKNVPLQSSVLINKYNNHKIIGLFVLVYILFVYKILFTQTFKCNKNVHVKIVFVQYYLYFKGFIIK